MVWRLSVSLLEDRFPVAPFFRRVMRFPADVSEAYAAPFPSAAHKGGLARWPALVPIRPSDAAAPHMARARAALRAWRPRPALVMFGDRDPIMSDLGESFSGMLPGARVLRIRGASHFLQETHGEELAKNSVEFMSEGE